MKKLTLFVLTSALLAVSCGGSPSTPTVPPPATTTDVFTGTVVPSPAGSPLTIDSHVFTVTNTGTATFSLTNTSLSNGGPPLAITIGFGVGTSTDGVCSIGYSVPASASSSPQITGTVNPGSLCVGVFDIGTMSANIDYSITVVHP